MRRHSRTGRCPLAADRSSQAEGGVGVFTTDRDLVIRSWDAWLADATGISEQDACGRPVASVFPEIEERGLLARLRNVVDTGAVEVLAPAFHRYLIPCAPRSPSNHFSRMQQHVTISPLRTRDEVAGAVVTVQDVTERLERERELATQLRSGDEGVRLRAARALAQEKARPTLLREALGDTSWRVRDAAAGGLARAEDASAVDLLVVAVRDQHRDPGVLNAAVTALIRSRQDVVPAVLELLEHEDSDIRTYAALALGQIGDLRATDPLLAHLDDSDANVRYHAIEAIGRLGARDAAPRLCALAEAADEYLAFAALDALGELREPSVADRILPLLDNRSLSAAASAALGRLADEDVAPALAERLNQVGSDALALAGALAELHRRLERASGAGEIVADAARASVSTAGVRALADSIPYASDAELQAVITVLGWLDFDGIPQLLAPLLEHPGMRQATATALVRHRAAGVPVLLAALGSEDVQTRKTAARGLAEIGSPTAVPALLPLLEDSSELAIAVAGALGAIGDRSAFEPLLAQLDNRDAAVRQACIAAVHSIGHPDTRERVRALLSHPSPRVRESAVRIAGYFGYPEALPVLLDLCADPQEQVRRAAVEHVAYFEDARVLPALARALEDTGAVRAAAARALAHAEREPALEQVRRALDDADLWVRYHAARSAAALGSEPLLARLSELALTDPAPPVRTAAAEALGATREPAAATALCTLAATAGPEISRAALAALAKTPGAEALAGLLAALESTDPGVRRTAIEALGHRGDPAAVQLIQEIARRTDDDGELSAALDALGRIGGAAAVAALVEASRRRGLAETAAEALSRLRPEDVDALAEGLHHPDVRARLAVVEALARRRDGRAAPLLAQALKDAAPAIRTAAAHALRRLDLRAVRPRLEMLARSDEDAGVREAAQSALHR